CWLDHRVQWATLTYGCLSAAFSASLQARRVSMTTPMLTCAHAARLGLPGFGVVVPLDAAQSAAAVLPLPPHWAAMVILESGKPLIAHRRPRQWQGGH